MRRFCTIAMAMAATLVASTAFAAELPVPPPAKPQETLRNKPDSNSRELSVYVNQPNCSRWTDDCVNCTRSAGSEAPTCSNIGFACQPKAIRCVGLDVPQGEPPSK